MPDEKIPCPAEGCDEEFADEAEAMAHMKKVHRADFELPNELRIPAEVLEEPPGVLAQVNPELLKLMDARIDARINAALEAYLPQVQEAVGGAMTKIVEAQAQGALPGAPPGGGVIPGSPVTPMGAQLLNWITKSDQPSDMDNLAKTLTQARAISDVLNPPTMWDRVMQNAVLRSLSKAGLVTDAEVKELTAPPAKP